MITLINSGLSHLNLNYRNEYIFVKGICNSFPVKMIPLVKKNNKILVLGTLAVNNIYFLPIIYGNSFNFNRQS